MKESRKTLYLVLGFALTILVYFISQSYALYNNPSIEEIIRGDDYNYLPIEAQDFIVDYYYDTGEILLTENNKVLNETYLNPMYVDYLLSDSWEGVIPDVKVIYYPDVIEEDNVVEDNLPDYYLAGSSYTDTKYNAVDYGYVTDPQDQGGSGLCWAFATEEVLESYLLSHGLRKTGQTPFLSKRHMDYATSNNFINYTNPYNERNIYNDGGTIGYATSVAVDGYAFYELSWDDETLDDFEDTKNLAAYQVFSQSKSEYEVNATTVYTHYTGTFSSTEITAIKKNIIANGGAYVSTYDPSGKCATAATIGQVIYSDGSCSSAYHAMEIVGWDDSNSVWILKNSWGTMYPYVYLRYYSYGYQVALITDVSEKNWDTNYTSTSSTTTGAQFDKTIKITSYTEQLVKVKFLKETTTTGTYYLYVSTTGDEDDYVEIDSMAVSTAGWYTFDLSSYSDLLFTNETLLVKVATSQNGSNFSTNKKNFRLYTTYIESNPVVVTDDVTYEQTSMTSSTSYELPIFSYVKGIPDGEQLDYVLTDTEFNEIDSNLYSYRDNYIFSNMINTTLVIDNSIEKGVYNLDIYYGDELISYCYVTINSDVVMIPGSGTEEDPYLISTPAQLNMIRFDRYGWYELTEDIDLTYDTTDPEGLFYNDGMGWEPIIYEGKYSNSKGFCGVINGNGHKIIGLNIHRPTENYVAFISWMYNPNYEFTGIHDLIFEDVDIEGKYYVGTIVGNWYGTTYERELNGFNLAVVGGSVSGTNYVGGMFGYSEIGSTLTVYQYEDRNDLYRRHDLDDLYVNCDVYAAAVDGYAGGIFGYIENINNSYTTATTPVYIYRYQVSGNIEGCYAGGVAGWYDTYASTGTLNLKDGIVDVNLSGEYTNQIVPNYTGNAKIIVKALYYTGDAVSNSYFTLTNANKVTFDGLKTATPASYFTNFTTYWNDDGNNVIPLLKASGMENTTISDITINGSAEYLFDYITPNNNLSINNITYTVNGDIIGIDEEDYYIYPYELGSTTIDISSSLDGYTGTINVDVDGLLVYTITFDPNGGTGTMEDQVGAEDITLNPNEYERDGYIFLGWGIKPNSTEPIYLDEADFYLEEDVTLYAIWKLKSFTVHFDSNGGTGTMEDQIIEDSDYLNANLFTKAKYQFNSWNTKKDGSGNIYTDIGYIENTGDITLYAQWERCEYEVTFNANGGTGTMDSQTINSADYLNVNLFKKTNYKFIGWDTSSSGTNVVYKDKEYIIFDPMTDDDITLYAVWEQSAFDVTFNSNTGTGTMDKQTIDGTGYLNINTFTKDKYEFVNWNTKSDGSGTSYKDQASITVTSNITLYAIWKQVAFDVTFNSNTGTGTMTKQTINKSGNLNKNLFTKDKYEFVKWNTKTDGTGTSYNDQALINVTSDVTLYAIWNQVTFDVTFNNNGGTGTMSSQTITKTGTLNKNTFTKDKYEFVKWNTKADGSGTDYLDQSDISVTSNVTLYAIWNRIEFTVTFNSNTGVSCTQTIIRTALLDENIFVKTGYIFASWNTKADGTGTTYNNRQSVTPTSDLTLYAQWERSANTVIFNANGGTGTMANQTVKGSTSLNKNAYTRKNYTFVSWNTKADGSGTEYQDQGTIDILDESIILYAIWNKTGFDVTFDPNTGTGTMDVQSINVHGNLNANTFTKDRYEFKNWNTKADGTGTSFLDKTDINISQTTNKEDLTLYAIWEKVGFEITFNSNSGTGTMDNQVITKSGTINANKFTKDRYEFKEWNTKYDGSGTKYSNNGTISLTEDITLYAIWEKTVFEITFNSNTGTGTMANQLYKTNDRINKNTFTKVGYTFKEWLTSPNQPSEDPSDGVVLAYYDNNIMDLANDLTLYATWTPITYKISFDKGEGTGTMDSITVTYDKSVNLPKNTFTLENKVFVGWRYNNKTYSDQEEILNLTTVNEELVFTAIFDDEITYEVKYEVDDTNTITNLNEKLTIDNYKNGFTIGPNYSVKVFKINDDDEEQVTSGYIGTGFVTRIYKNTELMKSFKNVVKGDVSKDGLITAVDYAKIKNHIMGTSTFTELVLLKAADYNLDSKVSAVDYAKIKNYILGGN